MRFSGVFIAISTLLFLLFPSCRTDEAFVPSYIRIDSAILDASGINGNNIHDIQAIQVYVNSQTVGTFPLPCTFPLDAEGPTKIQIAPFVKINGNSQTLNNYLTLDLVDTTIVLTRESSVTFSPIFRFRNRAKIAWQEDFEDSNTTLVPIRLLEDDYSRIETRHFDLNNRFSGPSKVLVSGFSAADSLKSMDLAHFELFKDLPNDGSGIFIEFDVKSELPVLVAVKRYNSMGQEFVPYMTINPTGSEWKHFYVNLLYEIQGQPDDTKYEIFFSTDKKADFEGSLEFLLDNIRLSYNQP